MKKRYLWMLTGTAAIVAADQLTKRWTVENIPLGGMVPMWNGVFHLTHLRNTGMAFSLFQGGRWIFLILTAAFLAVAVAAVVKDWLPHPAARAALVMIAGGGIGNLIDRAAAGQVVDMIEVEFTRFAVFNVADIFVTVGAALMLFWAICIDRKPENAAEGEEDHDDSV